MHDDRWWRLHAPSLPCSTLSTSISAPCTQGYLPAQLPPTAFATHLEHQHEGFLVPRLHLHPLLPATSPRQVHPHTSCLPNPTATHLEHQHQRLVVPRLNQCPAATPAAPPLSNTVPAAP